MHLSQEGAVKSVEEWNTEVATYEHHERGKRTRQEVRICDEELDIIEYAGPLGCGPFD